MDKKHSDSLPTSVPAAVISSLVVVGILRLWVEWIHDEQIKNWWRCLIVTWACFYGFSLFVAYRRSEALDRQAAAEFLI